VVYGLANGLIDPSSFDPSSSWFDPSIIPAIPKLLDTDHDTIVNAMFLLNAAKDRQKIEEVSKMEAKYMIKQWFSPNFPLIMAKYLINQQKKR